MLLKDKVVIITGASQGIGKAIALAFAEEKSKVVITYRNNEKGAREIEKEIRYINGEVMTFRGNLAEEETVKDLYKNILDKYGTIDILVNNAGKAEPKDIQNTNKEDWIKAFDDNFFSTVLMCKSALEVMTKNKSGKIINMSSINGIEHCGRPGNIAYSAAKGAVVNLTKTLAKGFAPDILVNAVAPGKTFTSYWEQFDKEFQEKASSDVPIKRFINVDEIAQTFIYIAKNDAITGEVITVDGGFNLKEYF